MHIIMEIQVFNDGKISTPCYAIEDDNAADSRYYTILAAAAVSKLPRHTVVMVTDDGYFEKSGTYDHEEESENEG